MDIEQTLDKHSAALGDSPSGILAAAAWREICSRMGFDSLCLRLDEADGASSLLEALRGVMESTLNDMLDTTSSSDVKIDEGLAGVKRKKRTPFIPKKEPKNEQQ